jgi:pimeloyl-ACP methyl ester carboxylesterase
LLLIHGIGGNAHSWDSILDPLAARHEVLAVDLPGFGKTAPLPGQVSIRTLCDEVTAFLASHGLLGIDAVGMSMGARMVLELARRGGVLGRVVSLDPGGFWRGWERHVFYASIYASIRLLRLLRPILSAVSANAVTRTLLLAQFSARPWRLAAHLVENELRSYVDSPSFDTLLDALAYGEPQQGSLRGSIPHPLVIGWGRHDRVCFPRQAMRAINMFPDAELRWFDRSGHFPHWDQPRETVRLILETTMPSASGLATPPSDIRAYATKANAL